MVVSRWTSCDGVNARMIGRLIEPSRGPGSVVAVAPPCGGAPVPPPHAAKTMTAVSAHPSGPRSVRSIRISSLARWKPTDDDSRGDDLLDQARDRVAGAGQHRLYRPRPRAGLDP